MQLIKLFIAFLLSSSILFSCSDNKTASVTNNAAAASTNNDGDYAGNSSLTYTIDGKKTAIKDYLKKDGKNFIALFINEVTNDDASGMLKLGLTNALTSEFFEFKVANKGSSAILHYNPGLNYTKNQGTYLAYKGFRGVQHPANFYADSVTVTVNSISASRVT